MRSYKRTRIQGGTFFLILTLAERRGVDLLVRHISALRTAFRGKLVNNNPGAMAIEAIIVLPDHRRWVSHLNPAYEIVDDEAYGSCVITCRSLYYRKLAKNQGST